MEKDATRLVQLLRERFTDAQNRRGGSYSLRAFARSLGIPAPVLSEIFRGKRTVTIKLARRICEALALPQADTNRWLSAVAKKRRDRPSALIIMKDDEFNLVSDWHYFAILSLVEAEGFSSSVRSISQRLGLSSSITKNALAVLLRLGLISKERGRYAATGQRVRTTDDVPSSAVQKNHIQGFELAAEALRNVEVDEREFSANTFSFDVNDLPQAKRLLRKLRREFPSKMTGRNRTDVYRLQIQFFPLTRKDIKRRESK